MIRIVKLIFFRKGTALKKLSWRMMQTKSKIAIGKNFFGIYIYFL